MATAESDARPAQRTAIQELAEDHTSRKRFMKMMGGTGAAGAFSILLAACGSDKKSGGSAQSSPSPAPSSSSPPSTSGGGGMAGDLKILNYALTLEYLEAEFYKKVIAKGLFKGANASVLKKFGETEQQHVVALTATIKKLGGTPATKPKAKFPLKSAASVLKLATTVEDLGAAAYLGQAAKIKNKEVLAAALAIHSVEARHAATLHRVGGTSPTPNGAFGKPADMATVLAAVKPFIVG